MNNTKKGRRLNNIELQLTPKLWAISVADEMRRYRSESEFLKAIAKGAYRQTPFTMPFYALAEQAHERWPEPNREHAMREIQLNCELRTEFQALKILINDVNKVIQTKAQTRRLKAALQLSKLQALILQGAIAQMGDGEILSNSSTRLPRLCHVSQLENWADNSAMLLMETTADKVAVQLVQEKYFERHPILFRDVEEELEVTIGTVRDAIAAFNEYLSVNAEFSIRESDHEQQIDRMANAVPLERESVLPIDVNAVEKRSEALVHFVVQKWTIDAKFKANADVLRETGKHEDFVWEHFQKEVR
jgi:hypothetical protein